MGPFLKQGHLNWDILKIRPTAVSSPEESRSNEKPSKKPDLKAAWTFEWRGSYHSCSQSRVVDPFLQCQASLLCTSKQSTAASAMEVVAKRAMVAIFLQK